MRSMLCIEQLGMLFDMIAHILLMYVLQYIWIGSFTDKDLQS